MIGSDVQPHSRLDPESTRQRQSKARAFDHERIDGLVESSDQGCFGVSHRESTTTRFTNHRRRHQRGRRLSVGPGDTDHRSGATLALCLPSVGEFDFRQRLAVEVVRDCKQRMRFGNTRCRHHEVDILHDVGQDPEVGCDNKRRTQLRRQCIVARVRVVINEHGFETTNCQCARNGRACNAETEHQRPRHQPTWRVKSPMNTASAVATQMPWMIQKRMMTLVSGQPINSKW